MQMTVREFVRRKALGILGLIDSEISPNDRAERLTFINDEEDIRVNRLREYNVWYVGDADELLNFYTRSNSIDFNYNPIYNRNKRSYFWSVSSSEGDIKRTHSGQPRNIVDTLVNIIGLPQIGVGSPDGPLSPIAERLARILDDNDFDRMLMQQARPLTMVEGWGAWKINYDSSFRDTPILLYYRADAVDFIYRSGQLAAIIYRDYYQDEDGNDYVLFETRRRSGKDLIIEKDLFRATPGVDVMQKVGLADLPQLKDTAERLIVTDYPGFLGQPSVVYKDTTGTFHGRSIYTGKLDMFDDLDQCMSQSANTVRRSTVHEYFNTLYLEKDPRTGLPKMPHDFDRKYVLFRGSKNGDGTVAQSPVTVTQPNLDFDQYSREETSILLNIISGIMSPATLGIDIAKKDNAEAQREKEKVTIFTRNVWLKEEGRTLRRLMNELLCADELLRDGQVTERGYDVYVKYDEFADQSFEGKLNTVLAGWQAGIMSDEMALGYLYGNALPKEALAKELAFMKEQREASQKASMPEMMGGFGELGAENDWNGAHEKPEV